MKIERATAKDYGQLKMLWSIVFQEEAEFLENFLPNVSRRTPS